jgi:hypothetical protein
MHEKATNEFIVFTIARGKKDEIIKQLRFRCQTPKIAQDWTIAFKCVGRHLEIGGLLLWDLVVVDKNKTIIV